MVKKQTSHPPTCSPIYSSSPISSNPHPYPPLCVSKMAMATLLSLLLLLSATTTTLSSTTFTSFSKTTSSSRHETGSPLTAKATTIRYWNRKITNTLPLPPFLLSKLSPLSPIQLTSFTPNLSKEKLTSFCSSANILCASDQVDRSSLSSSPSGNFTSYVDSNFTNYDKESEFSTYSPGENVPVDTFRRYRQNRAGEDDSFSTYSVNGNVVTTNFTSYSTSSLDGNGEFTAYHTGANVPDLKFTNYDTGASESSKTFASYTEDSNSGDENFASYGKRGNYVNSTFASYSDNANVINSGFSSYGTNNNADIDKFSSYGENGNVPEMQFRSYGKNSNGGTDSFTTYRNQSNVGDETFSSYGKDANGEQASFTGYGESFNDGSDNFNNYGEGSSFFDNINFTSYSGNINNFKGYNMSADSRNTFTFTSYVNASSVPHSLLPASEQNASQLRRRKKSTSTNKWLVEPGKFFRESSLTKGTLMPMPDIRDKMPSRSFLPRTIATQIPFSAAVINTMFDIANDTAMGKAVGNTVAECERAPSKGETKKCARSAEDMIDFAVEVLGSNVVVRTTENTKGVGGNIVIGEVKGINGGKVTKSVSCHQSLFPFLVYYCHSVPKVRVYNADILNADTKEKINSGVAICHIDTSDWSASHGAFVSLGSAPGKIEVCHWIFEGDMTWALAD